MREIEDVEHPEDKRQPRRNQEQESRLSKRAQYLDGQKGEIHVTRLKFWSGKGGLP
jgi:hypothetical protein